MSVDYPRAWEIARATAFEQHHPKCSYRTQQGGFLCDCEVLTKHPEYQDDVLQTAGGALYEPTAAPTSPPGGQEGG